jgi:bifunctional DNA-binding transcriptional regulator/antitoxin component of YhaV-PrlF toxin-antitoxin module
MCDSKSLSILSSVVDEFVQQDKLFTAFEVTLEAKKRGLTLRHRDVKNDIHKLLQPYVSQGLYLTELRDVGAAEKATVYFPDGTNVSNYAPLPRGGSSRFDMLGGLVTPAPSQTAAPPQSSTAIGVTGYATSSSSINVGQAASQKTHEPDGRGRICVPAELLRAAGLNVGDVANVAVENDKIIISAQTLTNTTAVYKVDVSNNIRLSAKLTAKASLTDKDYEFSGDATKVVVAAA